jgi:hypothetical protein
VFERAGLLWVFNFHPTKSFADYRVGVEQSGTYQIVLDTDDPEFGGLNRNAKGTRFFTDPLEWNGRKNFIQVYVPTRTAIVSILRHRCSPAKLIYLLGACTRVDPIVVSLPGTPAAQHQTYLGI